MQDTRAAKVTHWDPFRGFGAWSSPREFGETSLMSRVFDDVFGTQPAAGGARVPAIDVTESEDRYSIAAELPGVKKEDLSIELHEGVLNIRGEKRSARDEEKERGRWLERSFGAFHRAITLPKDADADQVDAGFADGVLTVVVHKRAEAKPRTVPIAS